MATKINKDKMTPSAQLVAAGQKDEVITIGDMNVKLKKPSVWAQLEFIKMIGSEASQNQVYMAMVMPALWVAEINGEYQPPPATQRELRAIIERIGEDGIKTILEHRQDSEAEKVDAELVKN